MKKILTDGGYNGQNLSISPNKYCIRSLQESFVWTSIQRNSLSASSQSFPVFVLFVGKFTKDCHGLRGLLTTQDFDSHSGGIMYNKFMIGI